MELLLAFNKEMSVCSAPANNKKLNITSSSTVVKSILPTKRRAYIDTSGNNKPAVINSIENINEIIIMPIVSGNFKYRIFKKAKQAVNTTRIVIIRNILIAIFSFTMNE